MKQENGRWRRRRTAGEEATKITRNFYDLGEGMGNLESGER